MSSTGTATGTLNVEFLSPKGFLASLFTIAWEFGVRVAINALPVLLGMTGIGSYAADLVAATAQFGRPHNYLYVTGQHTPHLLPAGRPDLRQLVVERADRLWEHLRLPTELASRDVDFYHSPLFTCPVVKEVASAITIHDAIPETRPDLCSKEFLNFYRSVIGPALRAADWAVTTSEFSKQEIHKHLDVPVKNIRVIYQGIDPAFSPARRGGLSDLRTRMRLPEKYVLFVGTLEPRKNVENLIRAFGQIAKEVSDVSLVIVGRKDHPDYSLQHVIAESGTGERICFPGYVAPDDLATLYAGAHVFAFPSRYEGFGRPVVEAMASGVPVVTSQTSSLPEIACGAAELIAPEEVRAIGDGLLRLCMDGKMREERIKLGIERAREFTQEQFGKRLVAFYNEVENTL